MNIVTERKYYIDNPILKIMGNVNYFMDIDEE